MKAVALVALALGLLAAWIWRPRGRLRPDVLALLALYAVLGGVAIALGWLELAEEPVAFTLCKPTVLYLSLATVLLGAQAAGWGYPVKMVFGTYFVFTDREWRWANLAFAVLCLALAAANLLIAFGHTRDDWEGFKWSAMVNLVAILILRVTYVWVDVVARIGRHLHQRWRRPVP